MHAAIQCMNNSLKFLNNVKYKSLSPFLAYNSKSIFPTSDSFPLIVIFFCISQLFYVRWKQNGLELELCHINFLKLCFFPMCWVSLSEIVIIFPLLNTSFSHILLFLHYLLTFCDFVSSNTFIELMDSLLSPWSRKKLMEVMLSEAGLHLQILQVG